MLKREKENHTNEEIPVSILLVLIWMFIEAILLIITQFNTSELDQRKMLLGIFIAMADYIFNFLAIIILIVLIFMFFYRVRKTWKYFNNFIVILILEYIIIFIIAMIKKPESLEKLFLVGNISGTIGIIFTIFANIINFIMFFLMIYFIYKNRSYFDNKNMPKNKRHISAFAVWGFVLGLFALIPFIGLIFGVVAITFGIIAFGKINKKDLRGKEFAKTAIILSVIGIVCTLLITLLIFFQGVESENTLNKIEENILYVKYDFGVVEDQSINDYSFSGSGIIYSAEPGRLKILTNRHVVDCGYSYEGCDRRTYENISVKVGGRLKEISKVSFAPEDFDAALLELETKGDYSKITISEDIEIGDVVFAVGYPLFTEKIVELSKSSGKITGFKRLFLDNGFEFEGISSDAYTYFGSSGGGLFDVDGNLIGMNTWVSEDQSYAIKIEYLKDIEDYKSCEGGYFTKNGECVAYCQERGYLCLREMTGNETKNISFSSKQSIQSLFDYKDLSLQDK